MSAVVVGAFKMTFGLFVNKARLALSEHLKDGDLNAKQLRSLIVTNMEDIKTKIDALARRELFSSASFIQEGMLLLNDLLAEPEPLASINMFQQTATMKASFLPAFDDVFDYAVRFKRWLKTPDEESNIPLANPDSDFDFDVEAARELVEKIFELKQRSPEQFMSAMESFKNAHTRATDEFFNESLSLKDRIMAVKLRIQGRLLMNLGNPRYAMSVCKLYLKELHDLREIVEIFRYDLEGGVLSQFNKAERHELVQSVSMINFALFRFFDCFINEDVNVYDWPLIENEDWMYNPLIPSAAVFLELQRAEVQVPNFVSLQPIQSQITGMDPKLVAVASDGDLILFRQRTDPEVCELLKVSRSEVKVFYTFPEFTLVSFLAIDVGNKVYVFADNVQSNVPPGYMMYDVFVFDSYGELRNIYKHFLLLDGSIILTPTPQDCDAALCIPDEVRVKSPLVVRSEEEIKGEVSIRSEDNIPGEVSIRSEDNIPGEVSIRSKDNIPGEVSIRSEDNIPGEVSIRSEDNIPGEDFNSLNTTLVEIKMWESTLATITNKQKVIAVEQFGYHVRVFQEDGQLVREFELHGGAREACVGITFNNLTEEVLVVSRIESDYFLSTYSPEEGKRHHHMRLSYLGGDSKEILLTSHCRGSIALITKEHVLFLQ